MLKVLKSKVCETDTKACVKALKKVKSSSIHTHKHKHKHKHAKDEKHTKSVKHKHNHKGGSAKHKTTHGHHHNIIIHVGDKGGGKKKEAAVASPIPPTPPFTPNPPPTGFQSYSAPAQAGVNRNDILALQKEFTNGLTKLRGLFTTNTARPDPKPTHWYTRTKKGLLGKWTLKKAAGIDGMSDADIENKAALDETHEYFKLTDIERAVMKERLQNESQQAPKRKKPVRRRGASGASSAAADLEREELDIRDFGVVATPLSPEKREPDHSPGGRPNAYGNPSGTGSLRGHDAAAAAAQEPTGDLGDR
jgi:hypothetical protein